MPICRMLPILTGMVLLAGAAGAAEQRIAPATASKVLTLSGETVHDAGVVGLHVTNFGLLGSRPGATSAYSEAPSLEYPLGSGSQNLFAAGVWIGGLVDGQARVSTGQYTAELLPDPDDPLDTIYRSSEGAVGGSRLPGLADDDGDGLRDEDPLNGFDDDGDGRVDEDFAAIGEQYFHAQMRDDTALANELYPDHRSMGLELRQESFAWSDERVDDLVGFRLQVENTGDRTVEDVYIGLFADFDIGTMSHPGAAQDDLASFELFEAISELDPSPVQVHLVYQFDATGEGTYAGVVLLSHSGPSGPLFGASGYEAFRGNLPFESGGDPTNDAQRYATLASGNFDAPLAPGDEAHANDYRVLATAGAFGDLEPGARAVFEFAFVMGTDLDGLRANAANAVALARGRRLLTGRLPWSLPEQVLPPRVELTGHWSANGARLTVGVEGEGMIELRRLASASLAARVWSEQEARRTGPWLRFRDADEGAWPRRYEVHSAQVGMEGPALARLVIDRPGRGPKRGNRGPHLSPNPFNPRTEVSFTLQRASRARLEIFDARGRRVRLLEERVFDAGEHRAVWDGRDDTGRDLASGLYFIRVWTPEEVTSTRAALVR